MNRWFLLSIILMIVVLTGCFKDNSTTENQSDDDSTSSQNNNLSEEDASDPPNFHVYQGANTTTGILEDWCWETDENPCELEINSPNEIIQKMKMPPLMVSAADEFEIWWSSTDPLYNKNIFYPDKIEVIQTRLDDKTDIEVANNDLTTPTKITAPTEKGRYYYSIKLKWDSDLKGEAHYVFSVSVQ